MYNSAGLAFERGVPDKMNAIPSHCSKSVKYCYKFDAVMSPGCLPLFRITIEEGKKRVLEEEIGGIVVWRCKRNETAACIAKIEDIYFAERPGLFFAAFFSR
jgi:hypothetical protein